MIDEPVAPYIPVWATSDNGSRLAAITLARTIWPGRYLIGIVGTFLRFDIAVDRLTPRVTEDATEPGS